MMCYRDMTFCDYKCCAKFAQCDRALTDEVYRKANEWMHDAPICIYNDKPDCFEEVMK